MKEAIVGTEIYTFQESQMWVACWRRFDVVAQGRTEHEAVGKLLDTIALNAVLYAKEGKIASFGNLKPVNDTLLKRWQRLHEDSHVEDE